MVRTFLSLLSVALLLVSAPATSRLTVNQLVGFGVQDSCVRDPVVAFDGTNDYIRSPDATPTGWADGKEFTFFAWVKFTDGDGALQQIFNLGGNWQGVRRTAGNKLEVRMPNAGTSIIMTSSSSFTSSSGWLAILASFDLAAGTAYLYVNDVDESNTPTTANNSNDYTATHTIGADDGGNGKLDAEVVQVWVDDGFIDISSAANRQKFYSASVKPIGLGADGSGPTGAQPLHFFNNPVATWQNNLGSSDNLNETGALTAGASHPCG